MNTMTAEVLSAQEICEKLDIPYSKINYYTYLGFFEIARKVGNKRFYDGEQVESRFRAISRLMNEGYPLSLIRKKLIGGRGDGLL
ncbi:MAG: MerR family transcriptional regulator [Candidatus Omnitrophota bacterium]|jgi:DNA-binding transcriptional MerR regulator